MPKVHSHYENLKVARDASHNDIRVAYRELTRKYHPDRNPGDAKAERIMAMINVAYEALSDPAKKAEHDVWIQRAEAAPARPAKSEAHIEADELQQACAAHVGFCTKPDRGRLVAGHITRHRLAYAAAGFVVCALAFVPVLMPDAGGVDAVVDKAVMALVKRDESYSKPATAPNGKPWPTATGYVDGYSQLNDKGLSEVTVDNSQNDTDMFVKLVSLAGATNLPVRTFFIAARGRFSITSLSAGPYDLRYRNLTSGSLSRSQAFILEDVSSAAGTAARNALTVPLYKGGGGYMKAYSMIDADF